MEPWAALRLPYIFERMVGFSLPLGKQVAIVSYDGIHLLDLNQPDHVQHDRTHPEGGQLYNSKSGTLSYQGKEYSILGLHGGTPIHESVEGERLDLDLAGEVLKVRGPGGNVNFEFRFEDLSGDWGHASFTADGEYILLGTPYDLDILQRTKCH